LEKKMTIEEQNKPSLYSGHIAIIGRPNVGKSTLLNAILGEKLSIVTRKPQTTREQILGIKTIGSRQAIYVDTPGMHKNTRQLQINRLMNRAANAALQMADVIVFLIDGLEWEQADGWIVDKLKDITAPVIFVINKIDTIKDKNRLYAFVTEKSALYPFYAVFPLSAKNKHNVESLEQEVMSLLPMAPHFYEEDDLTDRSERFRVTEIIREKVMRLTGREVPYAIEIEIQEYREEKKLTRIQAILWVEKEGQKAIVIGEKAERLKKIGQQAREDIERMVDRKVFLGLHVKVRHIQG
jgi:GTP-binding protein Era